MIENYYWILLGNFFLCINSGYMNSLTFLSLHQIASAHMTGNLSQIAINIILKNYDLVFYFSSTYFCFLLGSIITGYIIKDENFKLGQNYGILLILMAFILLFGIIIEEYISNSIYFILCCAFVCGLQNAMTSKYSNNIVRTTHMTGTTTDIGIFIGHYISGNKENTWKIKLLFTSIIGFFLGNIIGTIAYLKIIHFALISNILICFVCGCIHLIYLKINKL